MVLDGDTLLGSSTDTEGDVTPLPDIGLMLLEEEGELRAIEGDGSLGTEDLPMLVPRVLLGEETRGDLDAHAARLAGIEVLDELLVAAREGRRELCAEDTIDHHILAAEVDLEQRLVDRREEESLRLHQRE